MRPSPDSMASRLSFSIWTDSDGSAAGDVARLRMIVSASTAGGPSDGLVAVRGEHAAAGAREQRVEPHRDALVLVALDLDVVRLALLGEVRRPSSIISSHVAGGVGTRSDRYHSSWVLLLNGAAQSLSL